MKTPKKTAGVFMRKPALSIRWRLFKMAETLRHKRWERTGRTFEHLDEFDQVIPNKFTVSTKIGQKNTDAGDGTFAPYILNGASLRHGDSECEFADGWQIMKHLGQAIISRSRLFIQRDASGVWTDVPHGIPTRNVAHDYPREGKCTAYLDFPDIQGYAQGTRLQVGIEVGGNDRQTYGFRMRSPIAGTFRLEWVLDIPEDVDLSWIEAPTSRTDPTPIRVGGRIGQTEIRWSAAEAPYRSATVELDGAGGKVLHVLLGPYDLQPMEWLEVHPDTIAPTLNANEDDGNNQNGGWYLAGVYESNYIDEVSSFHDGFSFVFPADLAASATVSKMYMRAYIPDDAYIQGTVTFTVQTEDADPATQTRWGIGHLPSPSTTFINTQTNQTQAFSLSTWYFGETDTHPINLAADLTDLLSTYGDIVSGNRINIGIITRGTGTAYAGFEDYSKSTLNEAELLITYTAAAATAKGIPFQRHAMAQLMGW